MWTNVSPATSTCVLSDGISVRPQAALSCISRISHHDLIPHRRWYQVQRAFFFMPAWQVPHHFLHLCLHPFSFFSSCRALKSLIMSHPPLITLSPRCGCIYNEEHVHIMLIFVTPSPSQWLLWQTPVCMCACVSDHARREHTGCHRANICQRDLACQSWRAHAHVLPRLGMLLFAEIRDYFPGFFSPPVTLSHPSIVYCCILDSFLPQLADNCIFYHHYFLAGIDLDATTRKSGCEHCAYYHFIIIIYMHQNSVLKCSLRFGTSVTFLFCEIYESMHYKIHEEDSYWR